MQLKILGGGAAQGLVGTLAGRLQAETGATIAGTFSAIGEIKGKFLAGVPADLVILSRPMIAELVASQHLVGPGRDIGVVQTAVAVRTGDALPDISSVEALKAALLAADAIYTPDPKLATAGIHVVGMFDKLGIHEAVAARHKTFPNGMTAMREMAAQKGGRPIGCTQATEILHTAGITMVGPLPKAFELATVYSVAVAGKAERPDLAAAMAALLTGADTAQLRRSAGFDPV
jgi:molybdate transport system substrate-binding protein